MAIFYIQFFFEQKIFPGSSFLILMTHRSRELSPRTTSLVISNIYICDPRDPLYQGAIAPFSSRHQSAPLERLETQPHLSSDQRLGPNKIYFLYFNRNSNKVFILRILQDPKSRSFNIFLFKIHILNLKIEIDELYRGIDILLLAHAPAILDAYAEFIRMAAAELDVEFGGFSDPLIHQNKWRVNKSVFKYGKHKIEYMARSYKKVKLC